MTPHPGAPTEGSKEPVGTQHIAKSTACPRSLQPRPHKDPLWVPQSSLPLHRGFMGSPRTHVGPHPALALLPVLHAQLLLSEFPPSSIWISLGCWH